MSDRDICADCGIDLGAPIAIGAVGAAMAGRNIAMLCDACASKRIIRRDANERSTAAARAVHDSDLPTEMMGIDCDAVAPAMIKWLRAHWDGHCLLADATGAGKTACVVAAAAGLLRSGRISHCRFRRCIDLRHSAVAAKRDDGNSAQFMAGLARLDLLIIDDMGKSKSTEAGREFYFDLFDRIYIGRGPRRVWVTTRANEADLRGVFGDIADDVLRRIRTKFASYSKKGMAGA